MLVVRYSDKDGEGERTGLLREQMGKGADFLAPSSRPVPPRPATNMRSDRGGYVAFAGSGSTFHP
jgi:hypothetical protein